ncbi:alpha/beta fold hydrolase [bacterium]|nr:alpha/beta fold hydrolase [bacterium]
MSHYLTLPDGTRLAYADQGTGLPLLCLPGLTRTMADFTYAKPHLTGRLIRMDYRGRGGSSWTGAASYTLGQEAQDALALMDHLGIRRFAVLGTSRGGLIGMVLAHLARDRLLGLCLNDIGPVIELAGLDRIGSYLGRNPSATNFADFATALARTSPGFANVPASRWLEEAQKHAKPVEGGLQITYDPALRDSFLAAMQAPAGDAWPLYEACAGLPMAVIRGANSDLLSAATVEEMARRHPGLIMATVPDRGHVPFLDEAESLAALAAFQNLVAQQKARE